MAKQKSYTSEPKEEVEAKAVIEEPNVEEEIDESKEVETPVEEVSSNEPETSEEETNEDEVKVVSRPKKIVRKTTTKSDKPRVSYRQVVYVGTADQSTVRGAVTGNKYIFIKDEYKMPIAVDVDERDYPGIIALKGKGCARRDPQALFITKQDWDLDIAEAKRDNS